MSLYSDYIHYYLDNSNKCLHKKIKNEISSYVESLTGNSGSIEQNLFVVAFFLGKNKFLKSFK